MIRNDLFALADKKGHEIIRRALCETASMAVELDGRCYIALDASLPERQETELLAHELGHCEFAGFYSRLTPLNTRARIEHRAKKWQYRRLVPPGALREAMRSGITTPWELADYFSVSEALLVDAIAYYTDACGMHFDVPANYI